jgi:hypothetical protein
MAKARTVFLVQRCVTVGRYGMGRYDTQGPPVVACTTREEAERRRAELEAEAREVLPPFFVGHPGSWSSLGLVRLLETLKGIGLRHLPPPEENYAVAALWRQWWDEHAEEVTPEQRAAVWAALDRVELFRVVPVSLKG